MGAYVWGLELNAALSPILSMLEVVLRNSMHAAFTAHFKKSDWYQDVLKHEGDQAWQAKVAAYPPLAQQYYRKGVPPHNKKFFYPSPGVKKNLKNWRSPGEGKLEEILDRLNKGGKPQMPDQVVAHAMFGFWVALLAPAFDAPGDPLALWPSCTPGTFPNDPNMDRARAFYLIERVKDLRNRVSHHEPVWRIAAPLTPAGVNSTLTVRVEEMRELLNAMSPDVNQLLANAGLYDRLSWLLDPRTIASFAGQQNIAAVDLRALSRKVRKLAKAAHRGVSAPLPQPGKAVALHHAGKTLMTVVPHC